MATTKKKDTRAVGRPRSFDPEVALDAALKVFWENGYQAASLAILGEAMGLTPPQIYGAFKDKENLFRLALERYLKRENVFVQEALAFKGNAREAIRLLLMGAAKSYVRAGYPRGCLTVTGAIAGPSELRSVIEMLRGYRSLAESLMTERIRQDQDALPKGSDPIAMARFYSGVLFGMSLLARDGKSEKELKAYAEMALQAWPK